MNLKISPVLIAVLFFLVLTVLSVQAQKTKASGGERFYLFNAEYNSATIQTSKTTIFLEKRLFKIDRMTGDTWMLIDQIRNGRDIKYWRKINNQDGSK